MDYNTISYLRKPHNSTESLYYVWYQITALLVSGPIKPCLLDILSYIHVKSYIKYILFDTYKDKFIARMSIFLSWPACSYLTGSISYKFQVKQSEETETTVRENWKTSMLSAYIIFQSTTKGKRVEEQCWYYLSNNQKLNRWRGGRKRERERISPNFILKAISIKITSILSI